MSAITQNTLYIPNIVNNNNFSYVYIALKNNARISNINTPLLVTDGVRIVEHGQTHLFIKLDSNESFPLSLTLHDNAPPSIVVTMLYLGRTGKAIAKQTSNYKNFIQGFKKYDSGFFHRKIFRDDDFKNSKRILYNYRG